tara:strand:+ start:2745 stop:4142 length:1398 start_codon:yes stop_codon:yes gene_type:complete
MRWLVILPLVWFQVALAAEPQALSQLITSYKYESQPESYYSIDERMAFWQVPSISISTFKNGQVDWSYVVGLVGKEGKQANQNTRYQVASISKPVTALIVLRAMEKGLIDLDANVQPLLAPDFAKVVKQPVTLRQLLSHRAGFNHVGYIGVESELPLPSLVSYTRSDAQLGGLKQDSALGEFRYSNGGYILIQHVLEKVFNKPFEAIADQEVFKPLQMRHSSFEQPSVTEASGSYAFAYRFGVWVPKGWHKYGAKSAAGLWTTPNDLSKLLLAVHFAYLGKQESWLTQQSIQRINYPETMFMGLGFFRSSGIKEPYVFHGGINYGFESHFVLYPNLGTGAAVLTNGQKGDQLALEVIRAISQVENWPDYPLNQTEVFENDETELKRYVGRYKYDDSFYADVFIRNGMLYVQGFQQDPYVMHKIADNLYKPFEFESTFRFEFSDEGEITGLTQNSSYFNGFAKKVR